MIKIAKNPLFRICGIIAVLYYGLFQSNIENGLNKRFSPDKIKSGISEMSQKSVEIIHTVKKVKEAELNKSYDLVNQKNDQIINTNKEAKSE